MSDIVQVIVEPNNRRKIFKFVVFLLCAVGFIYQFYTFMSLYLTYPTSLEIFVKPIHVEKLPKPVITVCDNNKIRRTAFCKEYPILCYKQKNATLFCKEYTYLCNNGYIKKEDMIIPKKFSKWILQNREFVKHYGIRASDVLKLYQNNTSEIFMTNEISQLAMCHSLDLSKINEKKTYSGKIFVVDRYEIGNILLNFNLKDIFFSYQTAGIQVSLHSKDRLSNPFNEGFLVEPKMQYIVHLRPVENILLPPPYSTNCRQYDEKKDKPFNETFNQDRCIIECKKENWLKECGCLSSLYPFHFNGKFCNAEGKKCIMKVNNEECYQKCKSSCRFLDFHYDVKSFPNYREKYNIFHDLGFNFFNSNATAELSFVYIKPELLVNENRPRLEIIEIFSFAGGYVGIWLGISLVSIFDFFEWLTVYVYSKIQEKILKK